MTQMKRRIRKAKMLWSPEGIYPSWAASRPAASLMTIEHQISLCAQVAQIIGVGSDGTRPAHECSEGRCAGTGPPGGGTAQTAQSHAELGKTFYGRLIG